MLKRALKSMEDLFDRKLKNGTVVVVIISTLITSIGFLSAGLSSGLTANILQSQKNTIHEEQYIIIGEKKYKIILEEVR